MAQFGGGQMQMQGPTTGWCDYCHQKPKFPPYNYCGKACGSRAKATGSTPSNGPVLCKQCGQRPVYKGHQFCGRNCANTWQAMYGQINTGGSGQPQHGQQLWNPMPPPQTQNPPSNLTQPPQGFNQGGGLIGIVNGLKSLVSHSQQPQQQQPGPLNPPHMQQVSGPTSPDPMMISPPITPMSSGMGSPMSAGMGGSMLPGAFDQMSPETPTTPGLNQQYYSPSSPASPGFQDPNTNDQTNGQHFSSPPLPIPKQNSASGRKSKTMIMAMNSHTNPTGDDPNLDSRADPDQDPTATSDNYQHPSQFSGQNQAQAQAQFSVQVRSPPTGTGGHGNRGWDPSDPDHLPSQQSTSTSSGPPTTCRLKGCNKPVSVDPATHYQSEYCSQRHREEATVFGQVNLCIMCLKMPRGPNDHFCSRACRDKALSP